MNEREFQDIKSKFMSSSNSHPHDTAKKAELYFTEKNSINLALFIAEPGVDDSDVLELLKNLPENANLARAFSEYFKNNINKDNPNIILCIEAACSICPNSVYASDIATLIAKQYNNSLSYNDKLSIAQSMAKLIPENVVVSKPVSELVCAMVEADYELGGWILTAFSIYDAIPDEEITNLVIKKLGEDIWSDVSAEGALALVKNNNKSVDGFILQALSDARVGQVWIDTALRSKSIAVHGKLRQLLSINNPEALRNRKLIDALSDQEL